MSFTLYYKGCICIVFYNKWRTLIQSPYKVFIFLEVATLLWKYRSHFISFNKSFTRKTFPGLLLNTYRFSAEFDSVNNLLSYIILMSCFYRLQPLSSIPLASPIRLLQGMRIQSGFQSCIRRMHYMVFVFMVYWYMRCLLFLTTKKNFPISGQKNVPFWEMTEFASATDYLTTMGIWVNMLTSYQ